ncbi:MAG: winged helix DNA-binding domain-containing protein [Gemmatimonadota bacterium]|nr:winged helix DNA-binding domain-containing protein [Gemmatimonadota bacterium]
MKLTEIARQRLANQHLIGPRLATPSGVVATLGAVQAQDYPGAKWALAQRTLGAVDEAVEKEMTRGSILRTHVLRPTWHFVAPADIRWMLALTAPRVSAAMASYNRKLELDSTVFRRSNRALARALEGGRELTRTELSQVLRKAGIDVTGTQRLAHLMMQAELDAVVCSGARRGKQFTYALLDERVPATPVIDRDEALLRLAKIYFTTRGPATSKDFSWWSGLAAADVKRAIELARENLEQHTEGRETYWFGESVSAKVKRAPIAHLLPNYDEYFIGFKDRSAIGERLRKSRAKPPSQSFIANLVMIDGQLVGGWTRGFTKDHVSVALNIVTQVTRAERKEVIAAATSYGEFLGLPVDIRV